MLMIWALSGNSDCNVRTVDRQCSRSSRYRFVWTRRGCSLVAGSGSEEPADGHGESRQNRLGRDRVFRGKLLNLGERAIDRDGLASRIDEPHDRNAILKKLSNLPSQFLLAVARG